MQIYINNSPPETIPSTVLVTLYHSDIVMYNRLTSSMGISYRAYMPSELITTFRISSYQEIIKPEYVQLLAELDQLMISHCYRTQGQQRKGARGAPAPVK